MDNLRNQNEQSEIDTMLDGLGDFAWALAAGLHRLPCPHLQKEREPAELARA